MTSIPSKQSTNGRWLKLGVEFIILLFAIAAAWATLRVTVNGNLKDIGKQDHRITAVEKGQAEMKGDIRVIRVEQTYISDGIDDIKRSLE